MNTGLGLSFWRVVNEDGENGWAQVYARIPFDDTELANKGGLFGVIMGVDKENWAERDTELTSWVEEEFNKVESGGGLAALYQEWQNKYADLSGVWVWIWEKGGKREMAMVRSGGSGVALLRKGKEFDFTQGMVEGKVAKGLVEDGDRLALWTENLVEKIGSRIINVDEAGVDLINKRIKEENFAGGGIIIDFQKVQEMEAEEVDERTIIISEKKPEVEEKPAVMEREEREEVAGEGYVGPIGIKEKLINTWLGITGKIIKPRREGAIEMRGTGKRKKWAILLGVVFLALLAVSLVSGSIKMKNEAELKNWKNFAEPITKSLSEAAGLKQLNAAGAKKIVQDAKTSFDANKGEFTSGRFASDVTNLSKQIDAAWTDVSGEKESQIDEMARIDLVRQGFGGERMSLIKDKQLAVLDGTMGVVVSVELTAKDIKVTAGKGDGLGWIDVMADAKKVLVLNTSGVRNAITSQDLIKFDAAVMEPLAMAGFGGNLYLLDSGNKEIFRYPASGDGYGDRLRWLKQGQAMSIDPVDMAIDSDIWVVSKDGVVERFRRGSKENFSISGLTVGMKINRIAVQQDGDSLALLDSADGTIAVCSKKTGVCSQLLKAKRLTEAKDIEYDGSGDLLVLFPGVVASVK